MKFETLPRLILGSRSPQRRQLLLQLIPEDRILIDPPADCSEEQLDQVYEFPQIEKKLRQIARLKNEQVSQQSSFQQGDLLLTADTVIVCRNSLKDFRVLGQPPQDHWEQAVRDWFTLHYSGRTHWAVSAVCFRNQQGRLFEVTVTSSIRMRHLNEAEIEDYLRTAESQGKAGGYAIQGLASSFVSQIRGSLSNIIGLPLDEVRLLLQNSLNT